MTTPVPAEPKIYRINHVDRLQSIVDEGWLWCDAEFLRRPQPGTNIGMTQIKQRRLEELTLASHPELHVGDCVPFYFCPRSVMLYVIHRANAPELDYHGGQNPIIHLEADLRRTVAWAEAHNQRWAFTRSNAGSHHFADWRNLAQLNEIDWDAVQARDWQRQSEWKQAEFLIERQFPWELVERIGVRTLQVSDQVAEVLQNIAHQPPIEIIPNWYY